MFFHLSCHCIVHVFIFIQAFLVFKSIIMLYLYVSISRIFFLIMAFILKRWYSFFKIFFEIQKEKKNTQPDLSLTTRLEGNEL